MRAPAIRRLVLVAVLAGIAAALPIGYSMYVGARQEALIARQEKELQRMAREFAARQEQERRTARELAARQEQEWRRMAGERPPREALLAELQTVTLENCTLRRFGGPNDGGYLMCGNLLRGVRAAYSYGIGGEDEWGCQVSREFNLTIHQYDCFSPERPVCNGGRSLFHDECVGPRREVIESRRFDSIAGQIAANGDKSKRLLVKLDV